MRATYKGKTAVQFGGGPSLQPGGGKFDLSEDDARRIVDTTVGAALIESGELVLIEGEWPKAKKAEKPVKATKPKAKPKAKKAEK